MLLHVKTQTGVDDFKRPVYKDSTVTVADVLVTPTGSGDAATTESLSGKTESYELCIPKGDGHVWEDTEVEFFGKRWRTVGYPTEYIEAMLPLRWNKKLKVERHE